MKKIKRPASVLDEDDYTDALSDIIARDYFPGLQESRAQQEYLAALDSKDGAWIAEAANKLKNATARRPGARPTNAQVNHSTSTTPIKPEPDSTPVPDAIPHLHQQPLPRQQRLNTTNLSLSAFQARYTSEDNASFNDVLDKQNAQRRNKHAFLWTSDQRIPTKALVLHRAKQQELIAQHASAVAAAESDGRELAPLTSGATDSRPAQPDSWKPSQASPANSLMFKPDSIDQDGITTQQEERERMSKAGPKAIVLENTRFPPLQFLDHGGDDDDYNNYPHPPSSPSLNTDIINSRRNLATAAASSISISSASYHGGDTPRVNGYAFVDEDEPDRPAAAASSSYHNLLAAAGDQTPNPFKLSSARRRELLHHKLAAGNMTPAARKLLENLAKTPAGAVMVKQEHSIDGANNNLWTPVRTPRRHKVKSTAAIKIN
ncbi:hypothetical protein DV735_g2258, partial [Chaetothyriales sp. CBS 134920]